MDGDLCEHYNSLDPSKRRNIAEELDRTPAEVKKQDNRRGRAQEGRAGRGGAKKSTRGQVRARKSTRGRGGVGRRRAQEGRSGRGRAQESGAGRGRARGWAEKITREGEGGRGEIPKYLLILINSY